MEVICAINMGHSIVSNPLLNSFCMKLFKKVSVITSGRRQYILPQPSTENILICFMDMVLRSSIAGSTPSTPGH